MNKKNITFAILAILVAVSSFLVVRQHVLKFRIRDLYSAQRERDFLIQFFSYKSLPMEKLDRLDFIDQKNLESGEIEMQKHKVVFTGIARDNAQEMPMVMRSIEYLGQSFQDYRVIIFENDSSDATKFFLHLWQTINPKVEVISQDFFNKKRPSIKFLADVRNRYLKELENERYKDFDLMIAVDMDMKYGVDPRGIQDSFSKIESWDMVCSNGIFKADGTMYDGFAFRSPKLPYGPLDREDWQSYLHREVLIPYPPNSDLEPVYSCFGGLAIYKRDFIQDCFYDSVDGDCEHVKLHECMRLKHKARLFMNPAQILRYSHYN